MPINPIPGQPGLMRDDQTGEIYNIRDFREGDKYDTVAIGQNGASTTIQAGTEFVFFQDIQQKRELDTNIKTPRKLSAGESMIMDRIGLYVRSAAGDNTCRAQNVKKVIDNAFFRLKINDILQDEGPAVKFPSGYGFYGTTTENNASILSIGVPATASAARLVKKQLLNQNHELDGVMRYDARTWCAAQLQNANTADRPTIDEVILVTCMLHGLIRAAVTK